MIYFISKHLCLLFFKIWFGLEARNLDRLPAKGGYLVVLNHASNLDPPILGMLTRRIPSYLAKSELFHNKLFAWWASHVGVMPINRDSVDRKALTRAINVLKNDEVMALFPEGTRTPDGNLQPGKPGVAMIAAQVNKPCLAAYIQGSFEAWPRGQKWPRRHKIILWMGHPFELPARDGMGAKEYYQACTDLFMEKIAEVKKEAEENTR
ncbi:TPA: hypothetical protein DDW35_08960 [Candidatus Sumerlaeota bacterium]|jgi:1-acyl-sn-glycerol-3-phosphate acyltransferase|nr:hypothetical protein [Candidatus Sumerlaeota bacterium]